MSVSWFMAALILLLTFTILAGFYALILVPTDEEESE